MTIILASALTLVIFYLGYELGKRTMIHHAMKVLTKLMIVLQNKGALVLDSDETVDEILLEVANAI